MHTIVKVRNIKDQEKVFIKSNQKKKTVILVLVKEFKCFWASLVAQCLTHCERPIESSIFLYNNGTFQIIFSELFLYYTMI